MKSRMWSIGIVTLLACVALGCGHDAAEGAHSKVAEAVHGSSDGHGAASTEQVEVILARADAVDGTEDKVISQCAGCALNMEGTSEHALEVGEYEMHFCSDGCKKPFAEDAWLNALAHLDESLGATA